MLGMRDLGLEDFKQALGVDDLEGRNGEVSCAPDGSFHILVYGYTPHGQERSVSSFAQFARLVEIGEDGGRLFRMTRLPDPKEAEKLRRWLGLRRRAWGV